VGRLEYDPRRGAFRNWLFTIVRRKLANRQAGPAVRARGSGDSGTQQLLEQWPAPDALAGEWEDEWERRMITWACEHVRRDVSAATWQAFWMTAVDGRPGKQAASELGLTVAAVYHARSRVLARLKALVQSVEDP
jgi:RNA polymerase sigma-70 factor (ECF subfamily)